MSGTIAPPNYNALQPMPKGARLDYFAIEWVQASRQVAYRHLFRYHLDEEMVSDL